MPLVALWVPLLLPQLWSSLDGKCVGKLVFSKPISHLVFLEGFTFLYKNPLQQDANLNIFKLWKLFAKEFQISQSKISIFLCGLPVHHLRSHLLWTGSGLRCQGGCIVNSAKGKCHKIGKISHRISRFWFHKSAENLFVHK